MREKSPCENIKKVTDWLTEEKANEETCRSCQLPILGNWYVSELKQERREDLAKELQDAAENRDAKNFAEKLDQVKEKVEKNLKIRLEEFDCTVQKFEQGQRR